MARSSRRDRSNAAEAPEPAEDAAERADEAPADPEPEPAGELGEADEETLAVELEVEQIRRERDEYHERWQRARADYQNLRRRELLESEDRARREMRPLLERLLFVLDYLDMALASPASSEEARTITTGVSMTRDALLQALQQEGVEPIDTSGNFDPRLHDATSRVDRPDLAPGTIVETVRKGYAWREGVLRHAQVVVAAGGEERAQPEAEGADQES